MANQTTASIVNQLTKQAQQQAADRGTLRLRHAGILIHDDPKKNLWQLQQAQRNYYQQAGSRQQVIDYARAYQIAINLWRKRHNRRAPMPPMSRLVPAWPHSQP